MVRYPYSSLRQGLVGAWCPSLTPGSGTLRDLSPQPNHGSVFKTRFDARGGGGGGVSLVASDLAVVNYGNRVPFNGRPRFSASAWVYVNDAADDFVVFGRYATASNGPADSFSVRPVAGGTKIQQINGTAANYVSRDTAAVVPLQSWSHICWVTDLAADVSRIYLNGQLVSSTKTVNGTAPTVAGTHTAVPFRTGAITSNAGTVLYYTGTFDDLRFYERMLLPEEVALLASQRGIGLRPIPTAYWPPKYPLAINSNRLYSRVDGLWVPGDAKARESGEWKNAQASVKQAGEWAP